MDHGNVSKEIAKGLVELQARIKAAQIPSSKLDESLNVATWNICQFGNSSRSEAAIHYIAEILGQFDIIGVVELRDDLTDLGRVMKILGPYWKVVYSDMIPDYGGNKERIAFIYDKRMVTFTGLAAEANSPRHKVGDEYVSDISWWRSPYMASFRAGNFDFVLITAHIRYDTPASRKKELELLAEWIETKRLEKTHEDKDIIVMGDFNIPKIDDDLFKAITGKGLQIPKGLRQLSFGTNLERNKRYDQILHYANFPENFADKGGALDFYCDDFTPLFPNGMTIDKFKVEMSDHLPLWIQVKTDIDGFILDQIIKAED